MKPGDLVRHIHGTHRWSDLGIVLELFPGTAMYTKVYWDQPQNVWFSPCY